MKFKVGDRVITLDDCITIRAGTECVIETVDPNDSNAPYQIRDINTPEWIRYWCRTPERLVPSVAYINEAKLKKALGLE